MFNSDIIRKFNPAFVIFIFSFILFSCSSGRYASDKDFSESRSRTNYRILKSSETIASYYADEFHGKKTASGEFYNMYDLTAAHINYPFGTIARITNLQNNKSITVRINDRKPVGKNRDIDLSYKAAEELDMINDGIVKVRVDVVEWGKF
jgi:rare lipoprotein A